MTVPTPPYEILEHPADVGLRICGRTLSELFANAAHGLMALALRSEDGSRTQTPTQAAEHVPVTAHGIDLEDLMVNWLSEILYRIDSERWIFSDFSVSRVSDTMAEGEAVGAHHDLAARVVPVKAVTYHQLSVCQTPNGWEAVVYFDI